MVAAIGVPGDVRQSPETMERVPVHWGTLGSVQPGCAKPPHERQSIPAHARLGSSHTFPGQHTSRLPPQVGSVPCMRCLGADNRDASARRVLMSGRVA